MNYGKTALSTKGSFVETHRDGSGEHLYAANIITFFRISKFSVEKMLIGTVFYLCTLESE